jgi:hypothetical protein
VLRESRGGPGAGPLPDYRPIRFADNDGGEFVFPAPKTTSRTASTRPFGTAPATRN